MVNLAEQPEQRETVARLAELLRTRVAAARQIPPGVRQVGVDASR
jgi:hypothetical protein